MNNPVGISESSIIRTPEPMEPQDQKMHMHDVHCHVATVHKEWPPELVLALREAKNTSEWFCQLRELSKSLHMCGFGMA